MMLRGKGNRDEAVLRYLDGRFEIVKQGSYVLCSITKQRIPLSELCYWSVSLQESYATAQISLARYFALRNQEVAEK